MMSHYTGKTAPPGSGQVWIHARQHMRADNARPKMHALYLAAPCHMLKWADITCKNFVDKGEGSVSATTAADRVPTGGDPAIPGARPVWPAPLRSGRPTPGSRTAAASRPRSLAPRGYLPVLPRSWVPGLTFEARHEARACCRESPRVEVCGGRWLPLSSAWIFSCSLLGFSSHLCGSALLLVRGCFLMGSR